MKGLSAIPGDVRFTDVRRPLGLIAVLLVSSLLGWRSRLFGAPEGPTQTGVLVTSSVAFGRLRSWIKALRAGTVEPTSWICRRGCLTEDVAVPSADPRPGSAFPAMIDGRP
jgi:hypothetical protein